MSFNDRHRDTLFESRQGAILNQLFRLTSGLAKNAIRESVVFVDSPYDLQSVDEFGFNNKHVILYDTVAQKLMPSLIVFSEYFAEMHGIKRFGFDLYSSDKELALKSGASDVTATRGDAISPEDISSGSFKPICENIFRSDLMFIDVAPILLHCWHVDVLGIHPSEQLQDCSPVIIQNVQERALRTINILTGEPSHPTQARMSADVMAIDEEANAELAVGVR